MTTWKSIGCLSKHIAGGLSAGNHGEKLTKMAFWCEVTMRSHKMAGNFTKKKKLPGNEVFDADYNDGDLFYRWMTAILIELRKNTQQTSINFKESFLFKVYSSSIQLNPSAKLGYYLRVIFLLRPFLGVVEKVLHQFDWMMYHLKTIHSLSV